MLVFFLAALGETCFAARGARRSQVFFLKAGPRRSSHYLAVWRKGIEERSCRSPSEREKEKKCLLGFQCFKNTHVRVSVPAQLVLPVDLALEFLGVVVLHPRQPAAWCPISYRLYSYGLYSYGPSFLRGSRRPGVPVSYRLYSYGQI